MSKYIPVDPEKWAKMVQDQASLRRYKEICDELDAECSRLKAEVERWKQIATIYNTDHDLECANKLLSEQVERLTKAGDAMAEEMLKLNHPHASIYLWCKAKEGKQP